MCDILVVTDDCGGHVKAGFYVLGRYVLTLKKKKKKKTFGLNYGCNN